MSSKKRQTMAKVTRERLVKEKRARKLEKKEERKAAAAAAALGETAPAGMFATDEADNGDVATDGSDARADVGGEEEIETTPSTAAS